MTEVHEVRHFDAERAHTGGHEGIHAVTELLGDGALVDIGITEEGGYCRAVGEHSEPHWAVVVALAGIAFDARHGIEYDPLRPPCVRSKDER